MWFMQNSKLSGNMSYSKKSTIGFACHIGEVIGIIQITSLIIFIKD